MIEVELATPAPQTPRTPLRLGFAGAGWIGRSRLEALIGSKLANAVAIYEPAIDAAALAAKVAPGAAFTRSFEELLAQDLDGVVIATPNSLHASQSVAALTAGCAVFCQKPLARNAEETRA